MELTQKDIEVLLEIIDSVSVPVKQVREIIQPIITKLQIQKTKLSPIPQTIPTAKT